MKKRRRRKLTQEKASAINTRRLHRGLDEPEPFAGMWVGDPPRPQRVVVDLDGRGTLATLGHEKAIDDEP